jgi:hypothetical protein
VSQTYRSGEENFTCHICARPVSLESDEHIDEDRRIVHLDCCLTGIGAPNNNPLILSTLVRNSASKLSQELVMFGEIMPTTVHFGTFSGNELG